MNIKMKKTMNKKKYLSVFLAALFALSASVAAVEHEVEMKKRPNGSYVGDVSLDGVNYEVQIKVIHGNKLANSRSVGWGLKSTDNRPNKFNPRFPNLAGFLYDVNGKAWRGELIDPEGSNGAEVLKMKIIEFETGLSLEDMAVIDKYRVYHFADEQGKIIPMGGPCTAEEYDIAKKKYESKEVMPKLSEPHEINLKYHTGSETIYRVYAPGVKIPLKAEKLKGVDGVEHLIGAFSELRPGLKIAVARSEAGLPYDRLYIDKDSDGKFDDEKALHFNVEDRRGKWWSRLAGQSLKLVHKMKGEEKEVEGHTDLSYWIVTDSKGAVPEAIRFTNKTCSVGEVTLAGIPYTVILQDFNNDGRMTQGSGDFWYLKGKYTNYDVDESGLMDHYFYGVKGKAWKIEVVDGIGLKANIFEVEPHMTKREKLIMRGRIKMKNPDLEAPVAKEPIVFETDLAKALETAKKRNTSCFVKFETTWCGPCKVLNQTVFNKQEVAEAAKGVVCVKIDGDKHQNLVKKYKITGYPTMKMLDSDGNVTATFKGARNIKGISAFLLSGKK